MDSWSFNQGDRRGSAAPGTLVGLSGQGQLRKGTQIYGPLLVYKTRLEM